MQKEKRKKKKTPGSILSGQYKIFSTNIAFSPFTNLLIIFLMIFMIIFK